jgi:hypothetical protein
MDSTKLFLIVFVIFFQKNISSQSFEWAHALGSNEIDHINAHTTDQNGNIYITGSFKGTVDFDPGNGTNNLTAVGESDVFIQKLDPSGNLLWVKSIGGSNFDSGLDLTTDVNGNVFTTGTFKGTVDFDPGNGVQNLTSNGQYDVFIQKLNSVGNFDGYILKYGPSSCLPNATSPIYLELNLDENCAETSWDIKSQSGLTLHSGGGHITAILMEEVYNQIQLSKTLFICFYLNVIHLTYMMPMVMD